MKNSSLAFLITGAIGISSVMVWKAFGTVELVNITKVVLLCAALWIFVSILVGAVRPED